MRGCAGEVREVPMAGQGAKSVCEEQLRASFPNGELLRLRPPHPRKRDGKIRFEAVLYMCWFFLGRMGSRIDGAEEVYWVRFLEMDGLGFLKG